MQNILPRPLCDMEGALIDLATLVKVALYMSESATPSEFGDMRNLVSGVLNQMDDKVAAALAAHEKVWAHEHARRMRRNTSHDKMSAA